MTEAELRARSLTTDGDLARAVLAGERGAWEALAERYRDRTRAIVRRYVRNEDDAEEMTQEVFLRAYQALPQFRAESMFGTWLNTITVRMCLSFLREKRRRQRETIPFHEVEFSHPDSRAECDTEGVAIHRIEAHELKQQLATLSGKQPAALWLFAVEGLSLREIADRLECSPEAVKSALHRSRLQMKRPRP